jgi:diacylglycerol O-acyltransferase / wax synthase
MRQLTSLDAQFLAVESARTYGHVGGLAVYDPSTAPGGDLTVQDICRLVSERIHLLPPFRWRLVGVPLGLDHPYWVEDPDFDLDFHVRESAVPPPGDDRQLAETLARIFARPLDRTRPLWEVYLIQGLEGGRVALLTKVHHSVVDGVSGNEILAVLLDPSPEGREIPPPDSDGRPGRLPSELEMLGRGLLGLPLQPLRALRSAPTALPNLTELPGANAFPGVPTLSRGVAEIRRRLGIEHRDPAILEATTARPPRTSFNGRISGHRRFSFGQLSLDTVKAIKNEAGVTVNDVVVALSAGALRDWLKERDELPREPLVAMVPVSVRTDEQMGTFGNRVSMMILPIPTDEADPKRRLKRTHELLRGAKTRHQATPANLLTDATSFIPPALASLAARTTMEVMGRTRPPLNVVISNVPGPRTPLFLAGAKLEANYPVSVVVDGVGLNITVMSYLDHLDFGIVADRDQVDDVWALMKRLERSLAELTEAVLGKAGKRRAKRSAPAKAKI